MATAPERNRRFGLLAALFAGLVVLLVFTSLFTTCWSGDEGTSEQVAPEEGQGPAPGVE